jgi:hypothetical protein
MEIDYQSWHDEYPSEHREWRDIILNETLDDQFLWDNYVEITNGLLWNCIFEHQICSEDFLDKWIELQKDEEYTTISEYGSTAEYLVRFQPLSESLIKKHMDYLDSYIEDFVKYQYLVLASFSDEFVAFLHDHIEKKCVKRAEIAESVKDIDTRDWKLF